jgi:hypothetical protein
MKLGLHLKLAIGIVVVFGLLLLGFLVYEPVWFKVQEWRLLSDDLSTIDAAANAVAGKGKRAIPYIRKWLRFGGNARINYACLTLDKMQGNTWEKALLELEEILSGDSSGKNTVAKFFYKKGWFCEPDGTWKVSWKHFRGEPAAKRNLCNYVLANEKDQEKRRIATLALSYIDSSRCDDVVYKVLKNDPYFMVRAHAVWVLSKTSFQRAEKAMARAALCDSNEYVRGNAVWTLSRIGTPDAWKCILEVIDNDNSDAVREWAAASLSELREKKADKPLIRILKTDKSPRIRFFALEGLGMTGDERALGPILYALENDSDESVRACAAFNLLWYSEEAAQKAMEKAGELGNPGANLALFWKYGGTLSDETRKELGNVSFSLCLGYDGGITMRTFDYEYIIASAELKWGNSSALESLFVPFHRTYKRHTYFIAEAFSRLPENFPRYDYDMEADYKTAKPKVKKMKKWYEKNKLRLAWDEKKRRYFLREVKREEP